MEEIGNLFKLFNIECKIASYKREDKYSVIIKFTDSTDNLKKVYRFNIL
jgi:hypothetical protein